MQPGLSVVVNFYLYLLFTSTHSLQSNILSLVYSGAIGDTNENQQRKHL